MKKPLPEESNVHIKTQPFTPFIIPPMTTTTIDRNFTEKAKTMLTALGFQVHENTVTAPFRRGPEDINIPEDITEEVARIRWYEHVANIPAKTEIKNQTFEGMVQNMRITEQTLVEKCRLTQVETYPRVSEKMVEAFNPSSGEAMRLRLQNPVNPECPLLRNSFLYQFIQIAAKNAKFFDEFWIFDTGKVRTTNEVKNNEAPEYAKAHINELFATAMLLYKKATKSREQDTLLEAKGIVQTLLHALGLTEAVTYESYKNHDEDGDLPFFHPKKQGFIFYNGVKIWLIGAFHPLTLKDHKLPENANVCFVELNQTVVEELRNQIGEQSYTYETMQDQILRRDLSFVLDETSDFSELLKRIQSLPDIKEMEVFDLYQGENLPAGKKSLSIKIKLVGDGTMTTEQINEVMNKAIKAAESVGAELRG